MNKGIDDATKVVGQTVAAGADVVVGDVKGASSHVSSAATAAKDTAVDAATAGTRIAGDVAGGVFGMKSIQDGLDKVSNAAGSIVNSAGDAAIHGAAAAADTVAAAGKAIYKLGYSSRDPYYHRARHHRYDSNTTKSTAPTKLRRSVANSFNKVGIVSPLLLLFLFFFLSNLTLL